MSKYFIALLVTSVVGSICTLLASANFSRYIKYVASLICVFLIITPLKQIVSDGMAYEISIPTEELSTPDLYGITASIAEEKTESYISETVMAEFGIKYACADIDIDWDGSEPTVYKTVVTVSEDGTEKLSDIEAFVKEIFGGEVSVIGE